MELLIPIADPLILGMLFCIGFLVGLGLIKPIYQWSSAVPLKNPFRCPGCQTRIPTFYWIPFASLLWTRNRCRCEMTFCNWCPTLPGLTGVLFCVFAYALLVGECQKTPEVVPAQGWWEGRLLFQLVLISLLIVATGTDLKEYVIPDQITIPGMILGLMGATLSGDLQICHLWIDWNAEVRGLQGPWFPPWIAKHQHLHGFTWSMTGLLVGAGVTWFVRLLSFRILRTEAMGFGDVTLMAMIGSFVGWQPVLMIFLIAPVCGIVVTLVTRIFSPKSFLPYGPFLSAATLIVLFTWRWIWMFELRLSATSKFSLRCFFGDFTGLLIVAGMVIAGIMVLLILLQLYRMIPTKTANKH